MICTSRDGDRGVPGRALGKYDGTGLVTPLSLCVTGGVQGATRRKTHADLKG